MSAIVDRLYGEPGQSLVGTLSRGRSGGMGKSLGRLMLTLAPASTAAVTTCSSVSLALGRCLRWTFFFFLRLLVVTGLAGQTVAAAGTRRRLSEQRALLGEAGVTLRVRDDVAVIGRFGVIAHHRTTRPTIGAKVRAGMVAARDLVDDDNFHLATSASRAQSIHVVIQQVLTLPLSTR